MKYYLGGYFLINIRDSSSLDSVRKYLHTASTCINDSLLDGWSLSWVKNNEGELAKAMENFSVQVIQGWADEKFNEGKILWLEIFSDLKTLAEYRALFPDLDQKNLRALAIYFTEPDRDRLLSTFEVNDGSSGDPGLKIMLSRQIEDTKSGDTIGYDLIGVEHHGQFHSFHCHDLAGELDRKLAVKLNGFGLIADDANRDALLEMMNDSDNGFEPVPWFFVKVKMYS